MTMPPLPMPTPQPESDFYWEKAKGESHVFLHEGGHGLDPSSGKQNSSHSSERMACLIAGRAGGLKPGRHVVATNKHPAQVLICAMNAVGVNTPALGEVSGAMPELFTA